MECKLCQVRAALKQAEKLIDAAPVINSPIYDEALADLMNSILDVYSLFSCMCDSPVTTLSYQDLPPAV